MTSSSSLYSNSAHTLYAHWTGISSTVYFDANGGSASTTSKSVNYGAYYNDLPTPTRTGYTFDGWYTSASGGTQIYSGTTVNITSSQTLYAHWSIITYTVDLNANGGSCGTSSVSISYGGTYGSLPTPWKTGYSFAGWYTSASGGTRKYDGSALASNSSHTLYAHWTANPYSVVFNANGGSGSMSTLSCTYDVSATLPASSFSRTGYSFSGWSTSAGGSVSYWNGSSVWNLTSSYNGTVTLYAVWTGNPYYVAFNANGGSGSMSLQGFTYGTAQVLRANGFSRTGYRFAGWATSAGGGVVYSDGASVQNLASASGSTITLYAKWTANTYTISFNANGGSGSTSGLSCTYDTASTLPANGFARTGYTFTGWATSADGSVVYSNRASVKNLTAEHNSGVTLYAKWTANSYSVKFDANGGTGSMSGIGCTYDTSKALPNNGFSRKGYTFAGWSTSRTGNIVYSNGTSIKNLTSTSNGSVTLYAQWTANPYKVHFDANGGTGSMSDEAFTYDQPKTLDVHRFMRTGYEFLGWTTSASGEVVSYTDQQSVTNLSDQKDAVVTLYAVWGGPVVVDGVMTGYIGAIPDPLYIRADVHEIADSALAGKVVTSVVIHEGVTKLGARVFASCPQAVAVYFLGNAPTADAAFLTDAPAGTSLFALLDTTGWSAAAYAGCVQTRGAREFSIELSDRGSVVGSVSRAFGDAYGELPTPVRTGYTFSGWKRGETLVNASTLVTNVTAHALEAEWKANGYEVRCHRPLFNATTEEETETVSLTYDMERYLPSTAPVGYSIAGWATQPGGQAVYTGTVKNLASTAGDTVDLYAVYRQNGGTLQINLEEVNGTENDDALPEASDILKVNGRSDWTLDFRNRLQALSPGRVGSCTIKFQSQDPRWIAPSDLKVANDGSALLRLVQVKRANVVTVGARTEGSATGSVSVSPVWKVGSVSDPTTAQVAPGGQATLTAKAGSGSALAYWQDADGNVLGSATTLKVTPKRDTQYLAVFRAKTDAAAPELDVPVGESGQVSAEAGAALALSPQVALKSWPVKFKAKGLPKGLKINAASGEISGTPSVPGEYDVAVTATSALDAKKSTTVTVRVKVANFTDPSIPVADAYGPFMVGVSVSTNLPPEVSSCVVSGLPAGLKYDKTTGRVTGVPTKAAAVTAFFKKGSALATSTFRVLPLPTWTQGEFLGTVENLDSGNGMVSLSVSAAGKISGKIVSANAATFSADAFSSVDLTGNTNLTLVATTKSAVRNRPLKLEIRPFDPTVAPGAACARAEGDLAGSPVSLTRVVWNDKGTTLPIAAGTYTFRAEDGSPVTLTLDEKGGVKAAATFADGRKYSASTKLLLEDEVASVILYSAPNVKNFVPEFFAQVKLVGHAGDETSGVAFRDPGVFTTVTGSGVGTVTMNPKYGQASGTKPVVLTAKADAKSVFVGWELEGRTEYGAKLNLTMSEADIPVRAIFRLKTDYTEISRPFLAADARAAFDNLRVGVAFSSAIAVDESCRPVKFAAKNLPSGLKLDVETGVVTGVPTTAVAGSAFSVSATSVANGNLAGLATFPINVRALDAWAVGTFDGGSETGIVSMAISDLGKISGKWQTGGQDWTLKAASFNAYENGCYYADVEETSGKQRVMRQVAVTADGIELEDFFALRNEWNAEPLKTLAAVLKNQTVDLGNGLTLKVGAAGKATVTGRFVTGVDARGSEVVYTASCSAQLIPIGNDEFVVYVYMKSKAPKFNGYSARIKLTWGEGVGLRVAE